MEQQAARVEDTAYDRMHQALLRQRQAFLAECPVPADVRIDRINRAIALLVDKQDALAEAMAADFGGRPKLMSLFTDMVSSVKALKLARSKLKTWMRPDRRPIELPLRLMGAKAWVEYQPKGVVGLVSPWNFPVNLTFGPLAGIFAAGNRVMIKPSEITPATSDLMAQLFAQAYDEDEVAVFTGGPEVGQAFSSLPFDHLMFTGATAVGRHVMRAAADNLVPVTLELGGKSPVIVSRTADTAQLAQRIAVGKMLNAGQVCLAPDYLLVPKEAEAEIAEAVAGQVAQLYGDVRSNPDYTAVINDRHKARLDGYLADAKQKGAHVHVVGGGSGEGSNSRMMPLTILRGVTDQMQVMQEELFGPILPILPYEQIDEAIDYVNAHDRPLALYYFGTDEAEQRRVLDRTHSGGVTLNDTIFHVSQEELPFGGIGPSGMGTYHGPDGFKTFSHARAIYRQTNRNLMKLIGALPPYGRRLKQVLKMQLSR